MGSEDDRRETQASIRDDQAGVREKQAGVREEQAGVREEQAGVRDDQAIMRDEKAEVRDKKAGVRDDKAVIRDDEALIREEIAEARDEVTKEQRGFLLRYMKIILWVTVVLFITAIISIVRSVVLANTVNNLETKIDELTIHTDAAEDAAVDARDTLKAALKEFEDRRSQNEPLPPTAIVDALASIARIEVQLCGGPCDEVPSEE